MRCSHAPKIGIALIILAAGPLMAQEQGVKVMGASRPGRKAGGGGDRRFHVDGQRRRG